ncbi:Methyltransferase [Fructilactobacillus florum 8D]|uniref:Methyltransferase n=1 Tax=Fructilactobacillus florum 8D TaxID=1221538 RepID=W9EDE4_9LACO|nr:class I SAM-dependent methyltransferase [Fructilactobacillus florum]EKK20687.1 Methyltransferase [Fructilactobacillus florum 2F]ETO40153.1 Methyltransferase [Fructilactobacillus florum 8D]
MIYAEFASFYDQLFDERLYDRWLRFVQQTVPLPASVLDVACGTGQLLVRLQSAGFTVTGCDLSFEMLSLADQHLQAAGSENVLLVQANMLDLTDFPQFSAITCFDDSLCYLANQAEMQQVFQQVYQHLESGGKFLFDVITPYQTDQKYPGYMYNYHDEEQAFLWSSYAGKQEHSVDHELVFFKYEPVKQAFARYEELHHERTYPLTTYRRLLHAAGFSHVIVTSDFGENEPTPTTTRWFVVAEKRNA